MLCGCVVEFSCIFGMKMTVWELLVTFGVVDWWGGMGCACICGCGGNGYGC